ncbi:MAG TPA: type II CAAX endopeptidase family protein [Acidimicrobiales bacterium]
MTAGRAGREEPGQRSSSWGLGDAAAGIGLALFVPSLVVVVALKLAGVSSDDTDTIALWAVALLQVPLWVVLGGVPWWVARHKGSGSLRTEFGFTARPRDVVIGLAAGFGSQLVLAVVLIPVYELLDINRNEVGKTAQTLADRAHDPLGYISLFIVAVLGAAVFEELFYRGLVLGALRKRWGDWISIVVSSVIFGVMHFQPVDTIALTLFGVVCAWLTVRYGRLGPSICAHFAFNLTAFVALLRH